MNRIDKFKNGNESSDLDVHFYLMVFLIITVLAVLSFAGTSDSNSSSAAAVPDYACTRLTGDWCGERTKLAEKGIKFDIDMVQSYQGVLDGGLRHQWKYGGSMDYRMKLDFEKMGLWPGGFVDIFAETQFGEFINRDTGAIIPANTDGVLPYPERHVTTLTQVLYTQFFSQTFGLFFGKICTFSGDWNYFASGWGNDQFMNLNLVINPVTFRTVPYSALGGGAIFLFPQLSPNPKQPSMLTVNFLGPNGESGQWPWDDFSSGTASAVEFKQPTKFFGKQGSQLVGATYSSKDFAVLDQDHRLILDFLLGFPVTPRKNDGSWSFYYNFYQFLYEEEKDPSQGFGVFGRFGTADDETNPIENFYSIGLGGKGIFDGRDKDTFGVGYYYSVLSDKVPDLLHLFGDSQGFEVYYNIEVNPWLHIAPDFQIINPSNERIDTTYVAGFRVRIDF